MGTDIEAAAIRRSDWGARRPCAGGAIADAALGLEGAVAGVVSVAAAGLSPCWAATRSSARLETAARSTVGKRIGFRDVSSCLLCGNPRVVRSSSHTASDAPAAVAGSASLCSPSAEQQRSTVIRLDVSGDPARLARPFVRTDHVSVPLTGCSLDSRI